MDRIERGDYIQTGGNTYLVLQHNALNQLPTIVALPALPRPLPHRPPLVLRDNTNNLWIHTFAPATLLRTDITATVGHADNNLLQHATQAVAALLQLNPLQTATHLQPLAGLPSTPH